MNEISFPSSVCQKALREVDRLLLSISARWPCPEPASPGARRIARYYDALARRWLARWEGPLLERSKAAEGGSLPWSARLDFTVTLHTGDLLSLYLDVEEITGSKPRRLRLGDTWRLPGGDPVSLRELLPRRRWWRAPVLEEVRLQIGRRVQSGECLYYDDWPSLVSRRFSPRRFYLTPSGPVVFYPMESIAPALEGFPTFSLSSLTAPPPG